MENLKIISSVENLEIILSTLTATFGFLVTAVTFLVKSIKNAKAKKALENIAKVCNSILPFIKQAETFTQYTGAEKKEFVMTKANQFAIENKIPFNAETISEQIEQLVKLTKEVNSRDKDKTANKESL